MMVKLFLWNHYHHGDLIYCKPLVREILNNYSNVEIAWGCYKNHAYLLEDLPIRLIVSEFDDRRPIDLSYLCPPGFANICLWQGQYTDTRNHQWYNVVEIFNRRVAANNISMKLGGGAVPMVTFPYVPVEIRSRGIYLENGPTRSRYCEYLFDMHWLSIEFPGLNFYCTAKPYCERDNVFDCTSLNMVELSWLSNRCDAILGRGSGPYICTNTEANRFKPKAVVGYDVEESPTFWDYPGNTLEYLQTSDEVLAFLHRVDSSPRKRLV